ncbi:MAG: hypothetical protein ACYDD1_16465 [Caulobacteraceae bacterium]
MRAALVALPIALALGSPMLSGCVALSDTAMAMHEAVFHTPDDAPAGYTKDALAEAAVLYPPAQTTVIAPSFRPRLAAAIRAAGYAVTDAQGPAAAGAIRLRFDVHTGAAGIDVAVLQMDEQTLTRGYQAGVPVTGWSFNPHNARPITLERLSLIQRGIPVDQVSYALAGAPTPTTARSDAKVSQP